MATGLSTQGLRIGEVLKRTRTRRGLEMREVEERTKIRIKYLRAIEAEDWTVLPSSAYAKGFIRTYAQLLGLDADALVDEYRRQAETDLPASSLSPFGEPVLEGRPRPPGAHGGWRPRAAVLGVIGTLAVVVVLVLGLTGGTSSRQGHPGGRAGQDHPGAKHGGHAHGAGAGQAGAVALRLKAKNALVLCLVGADGRALIDSQTLGKDAKAGPFSGGHFRLDLENGGRVKLNLGGSPRTLRSRVPASFRVLGSQVQQIAFKGRACP